MCMYTRHEFCFLNKLKETRSKGDRIAGYFEFFLSQVFTGLFQFESFVGNLLFM